HAAGVAAAGGPDTAVMAMVKANGYGHGLAIAADAAIAGGARWLGVVSGAEAVRLVDGARPILVVTRAEPEAHTELIDAGVELAVWDVEMVRALAAASARA